MKLTVKIEAKEKVRGFVRDFEDYGRINRPFDTKDFVELENAVILTVDEAKRIMCFIEGVNLIGDDLHQYIKHIFKLLKDGIEKAEKVNV